jgi:transposase
MIEIGMDQHKRFSAAAALNAATGEVVVERRLEHDDVESIRSFLRSFEGPVRVTLETTGNWYWLADLVEDAGATVRLCHTVEAKRRRRGKAKNDRIDALALAELSAEDRVPEAYIPAREDRDRRERHRFRIRLVRLQTIVKNSVHALLSKLNIEVPFEDAFGKGGRAYLEGLSLREPYAGHLRSALRVLDALAQEIAQEQSAIQAELKSSPLAELLMTAPGIGALTAYLMLYEIGPIERFPSDKQFASYCTLAPQTEQSSDWQGRPGVGRAGNLYLKEAFTNAVLGAIRKDPTIRVFYNRQLRRNGAKKAKVAAAHKLAVAVYHMLRRRQPYRPAPCMKKQTTGKPVLRLGRP